MSELLLIGLFCWWKWVMCPVLVDELDEGIADIRGVR